MTPDLQSPWGLLCLVVLVPLGLAAAIVCRQQWRAAFVLGLERSGMRAAVLPPVLLAVAVSLLALAASRPVLRTSRPAGVLADAQAYLVVDTSMSMLARPARTAPSRIVAARAAADRLLGRLPEELPVGLAEMPQGVLPLLTPTTDRAVLRDALHDAVEVQPVASHAPGLSPPASFLATSMAALQTVVLARFFDRTALHRVVVLVTDAETAPFDRDYVARPLLRSHVHLVVVRVGSIHDRLWREIDGAVRLDRRYHPPAAASARVVALAKTLGGDVYHPDQIGRAIAAVDSLIRPSRRVTVGRAEREIPLGPYAALAGLVIAAIVFGPVLPAVRPRRLTQV